MNVKVKNVEKKEKNLTVLTISVDAETFEAAVQRVYRKKVATMHVPGFRKGKAPRKLVESMFGKAVFYEDAINETYRTAYDEAIEQEDLSPVEAPDVDIESIDADGYTFTAAFHVYPMVEIGEYKSLEAVMPSAEPDEAEIDAEIESLRERNASLVAVDRPAAEGDTVIFDYEGLLDGVPFDGGSAEKSSLELGSGRFIPGFEEKLVGVMAGTECDIDLRFPEEYHAEHLAGKDVVFRCKVHEVKEKRKPELDDEFAKDVSEFDTLEEYKASLREKHAKAAQERAESAFEESLINQLIAELKCDVPDCMVKTRTEDMLDDLERRLRRNHMDLDVYCRLTGQSEESVREEYQAAALRQVQSGLIFDEIARREAMEINEDELDAEYTRLAALYGRESGEVRALIDEKALRQDLLALKASKFVVAQAVKRAPDEEK